jgi:hypothetical protein
VNTDTVTLVERTYGDLVDDILTSIVGGVVNEPIRFDIKTFTYPLAEPASGVRGISGTAAGKPRNFLLEIDFVFGDATNVVTWLDDGTRPDDDTTFFVDYFRVDSRSPLTDINIGYASAFIDTATGKSLDYVVSILDVTRKTAEFAVGLVTFFRAGGITGNISIPAGTRMATKDGKAVFVAAQPRTLQDGQVRIDVPVRADVGFAGDAGLVPAGQISEMTQPVAGIDHISNLDPTIRAAADETDDELRLRAKAALRALGKATIAALDRSIRESGGRPVEFFDPNGPVTSRTDPGSVTVVVDAEPERLPSLTAAVHDTRAAGVLTTLVARYVFITPRVVATIKPGISAPGKTQIAQDIVAALQAYVDGLTAGDAADGPTMLGEIKKVDDVTGATIKDVVVATADLSGAESDDALVDALVSAVAGAPAGDAAALRTALSQAVDSAAAQAPSGRRTPNRALLVSTDSAHAGQQATDADLEAGTFEVSATVAGDAWWIALDMAAADVHTEDGSA